jgi:drug/metabolite transporter (DMT)-like permease
LTTLEPPTTGKATPARCRADVALACVAFIWGTTFVVVKQALTAISAMYFLSIRFTLASACLLLMFLPAFRRSTPAELRRGFKGGLVAGLFLWLGYMLQTLGLKYTTAGNSGFLTGLYIVLVPLTSAAVYRRWPRRLELLGIGIASIGMAILTMPSFDRHFHTNRGDLLTVGCAVAFACHLLVLGHFSQRECYEAVALGQIACAAFLSFISLLAEPPQVAWGRQVLFAIVLTAVLATAAAFALQTWGQRYTTPTRTALIFALEPVFALVTAVSIGGESLTIYSIAGGVLILTGILTVELKPAKPA